MTNSDTTWVVADIGGTNFRLGCLGDKGLLDIVAYSCREFTSVAAVLDDFIRRHALKNVAMCLAIASPVRDDEVTMTNLNWKFSRRELQKQLGLKKLLVINDYAAQAMAIPELPEDSKIQLGGKHPLPGYPLSVCGPGTGLGVAHLVPQSGHWKLITCEGGHTDFAPSNELEIEILRLLYRSYTHVSAERLLSGPGLELLYRTLCEINQMEAEPLDAIKISQNGVSGSCQICLQTLNSFCAMLGSFCGNLALMTGAFGGIYLTGGIIPGLVPFIRASDFRQRFEDKGRYRSYNTDIPCFIVSASDPGLTGAAAYIRSLPEDKE